MSHTSPSFAINHFSKNGSRITAARLRPPLDHEIISSLDNWRRRLLAVDLSEKQVHETLDELFILLRAWKMESDENEWKKTVQICRAHPLKSLLHEDPFTRRAYEKPRGYAGDAKMLDYIYGREEGWAAPQASEIGRRIFNYTTLAPASEGVRARRGFIAHFLDQIAEERTRPDVLSIACGHLREAMLTASIKRRKFGRFIGLDSDRESLAVLESEYGRFGVETICAPVRQVLVGKFSGGSFDVVYSLGLFDYLNESVGRRLVARMFDMLRTGGKLLVANFLPQIHDIGYMEAYMDWMLIYRSRREMIDLTMELSQHELRDIEIFAEENQNIIFLLLTKN